MPIARRQHWLARPAVIAGLDWAPLADDHGEDVDAVWTSRASVGRWGHWRESPEPSGCDTLLGVTMHESEPKDGPCLLGRFGLRLGLSAKSDSGPVIPSQALTAREKLGAMTGPGIPVTIKSGDAQLLRLLRDLGGGTRAELMERTGWSRPRVTQHLEGLLGSGIVARVGDAGSTGGRPATRFAFDASAGVVLAACLRETSAHVAIADLAGRLLVTDGINHQVEAGPLPTLEAVADRLDALRERAGLDPSRVWGVGVGLPAPVEFARGRPIHRPTMPGWDGFPVADWLRERFGCIAIVDNDANVMARGEHDLHWRDTDQLIYVKADTGMRAGLIVGGNLHHGAQGLAGNIGHIYVPGRDDAVCACGNLGCLEAVAGGRALAARLTGEGLRRRRASGHRARPRRRSARRPCRARGRPRPRSRNRHAGKRVQPRRRDHWRHARRRRRSSADRRAGGRLPPFTATRHRRPQDRPRLPRRRHRTNRRRRPGHRRCARDHRAHRPRHPHASAIGTQQPEAESGPLGPPLLQHR